MNSRDQQRYRQPQGYDYHGRPAQPDRRRRPQVRRPGVVSHLVALVVQLLLSVLSGLTVIFLLRYEILPLRYRLTAILIILLLNIISMLLLLNGARRRSLRNVGIAVGVLLTLTVGTLNYYIMSGIGALDSISQKEISEQKSYTLSVLVLKDSPVKTVNDLKDKQIEAPQSSDGVNISSFVTDLTAKGNIQLKLKDVPTYLDAAANLMKKSTEAIVFNDAYLDLVTDEYPDFLDKTRMISEFVFEKPEEVESIPVDTSKSGFNLYISGIDRYGPITAVSRSDVNILMTVNPNTKKVLLTTLPRDAYVPIAGGGRNKKDKLTHAGIYGVNASVQTMARVFQTDINYYVRVNFSSVVNIVDKIGGITVHNPVAFSMGKHHFKAGNIRLNGEQALAFSRERKSLSGGDMDRGRNQERVITGIINKVISPQLIRNYTSILQTTQRSVQTNMTTTDIMRLVNTQLEKPGAWDIEMISISGKGQMGLPSYAMPGYRLYMFVPSQASINNAKAKIDAVLAGQ